VLWLRLEFDMIRVSYDGMMSAMLRVVQLSGGQMSCTAARRKSATASDFIAKERGGRTSDGEWEIDGSATL